jgi:ribosomal protein S11
MSRKIQIGMVKAKNDEITKEDELVEFENKVVYVQAAFNNTILNLAKVVAVYMAGDTARRVIINRLSK